jgi:predicted restriction endonuclease
VTCSICGNHPDTSFCKKRYAAEYYQKHKQHLLERNAARRRQHTVKYARYGAAYYRANKDKFTESARKRRRLLRSEVLLAYGHRCACCGETRAEFLAVDHINGGGAQHRKDLLAQGQEFYRWLKANSFPKEDFRLLCHNCNVSRGMYGQCPHEVESGREDFNS